MMIGNSRPNIKEASQANAGEASAKGDDHARGTLIKIQQDLAAIREHVEKRQVS